MVWQARNSDNSTRTPSAFVRRDKDNNVVAGGLLGQNAYDRHTAADLHDEDNPTGTLTTDSYGNQYYNWSADYVHHKVDNSTDAASLGKSTKPHVEGTLRVGSEVTIFKGAFTGGVAPVTLATKLQARTAGSSDAYADLTTATSATTHTYTLVGADAGKELRATTTATDDDSNTLTNDGNPTAAVANMTVATETSYTGVVKAGEVITITGATALGGVAPVQYLIQVRLSPTGSGDWTNTNVNTSNTAGKVATYTLPSDSAGKYLQVRTRIRDTNGGTGYVQLFSTAPGGNVVIVAPVTVSTAISYTGFVKVGKDLAITGATGTGGITPLRYQSQVTFDSGAPDFDVNTINMGGSTNTAGQSLTYTLPDLAGSNVTFRTVIQDNDGGDNYQEVISSTSQATIAADMTSTGDNGTMTGVFKAGETVSGLALPTFNGGIAPYTYAVKFQVSADGSSGWADFGGGFTDVGATLAANEATATLTASEATKYIRMQTEVTDATGDTLIRGGVTNGPIVAALEGSGNSTLSGTLQDTQTLTVDGEATFSGGVSPVTKEFQWQISDTGSGGWTGWGSGWVTYETTVIGETKVIATADVGKYVRLQQRATDGSGTIATRSGTVYGAIIAA